MKRTPEQVSARRKRRVWVETSGGILRRLPGETVAETVERWAADNAATLNGEWMLISLNRRGDGTLRWGARRLRKND